MALRIKFSYCVPVFIAIILTSCSSHKTLQAELSSNKTEQKPYAFFVAGHVYGFPGESKNNIGVHPPFKKRLDLIRNNSLIEFGVFTGDIVEDGTKETEWDELDADIAYINKKVYFAPGNHDIGNSKGRAIFKKRYGNSYRSFVHKNDLIIILDPNLDKWNISEDQLSWLKNVIERNAHEVDNIFVFFHQLLWWTKDGVFKNYPINSTSGRAENVNFWSEIYPLFENTNKPTFMFAGDTGVYKNGVLYFKFSKNISFIASGMGGRKQDNFIIAKITENKSVEFELVSLNSESLNALGKLEQVSPWVYFDVLNFDFKSYKLITCKKVGGFF
ncbi:MAG: metallophosphoesterase [Maribacter sp.]|uniref:metallophosphoesterase family protein n=1 Tax=Maribacter sp. TaxID=1897614 RepID=UPI0032986B21